MNRIVQLFWGSRSCLLVTTGIVCLQFACDVPVFAGENVWPGWLGPNRNGWVDDFEPPQHWPKELQQTWRVEVGTGYGSPLVAGKLVFQHARQGEEEVLWCFDLETGKERWRKSYTVSFKIGGGGERHGKGPKSCPVYADGRLFTFSINGLLSAWEAKSGELLWRSNFGKKFKSTHPYWGASASPIVDGDRVIVRFGTDDEGELVALNVKTGKKVWSLGKDGPSYSSPLVVEIDGIRQVIDWNHESLIGVEIETGKLLWEQSFPHEGHNQNMPTPTFYEGRILLGAENRGIRCFSPKLSDGKWTVEELWHQDKVALDMSTAIINGGYLYGLSHYGRGKLFSLDVEDGRVVLEGPGRTGENVTFLAVPGHIVALTNRGGLSVLEVEAGEVMMAATYRVAAGETWAPPVLLPRGRFLIKDLKHLTLWSPKSDVEKVEEKR